MSAQEDKKILSAAFSKEKKLLLAATGLTFKSDKNGLVSELDYEEISADAYTKLMALDALNITETTVGDSGFASAPQRGLSFLRVQVKDIDALRSHAHELPIKKLHTDYFGIPLKAGTVPSKLDHFGLLLGEPASCAVVKKKPAEKTPTQMLKSVQFFGPVDVVKKAPGK